MALKYTTKKPTVALPPSGVAKPVTPAPKTPNLGTPAPTPAPAPLSYNPGIVKPPVNTPTVPPPLDRRPTVPTTPNDKPVPPKLPGPVITQPPNGNAGVVKPTSGGVVVYNPQTTPKAPVPTVPTKGGNPSGQNSTPDGGGGIVLTPSNPNGPVVPYDPAQPTRTPQTNPGPVKPPVDAPPNDQLPPTNRTETRTTPIPTVPTKDGKPPGQNDTPDGGGGVVKPNDQRDRNWVRQNETPQQRLDRLKAKLRDQFGGSNPALEQRIKELEARMKDGSLDLNKDFKDQPGRKNNPDGTPKTSVPRVQLDDDPTTWTPEMLAELAPPRGMDTIFYDNARSTDKKATDPLTGKPKKGDSDNDGVQDKNEVRRSETLQQRLKRLQKKKKETGGSDQLNERIKKLKDRVKAQGGNVSDDEDEADEGGKSAKLNERLNRLQEKYKSKPSPELKARIDKLKGRVKGGSDNASVNSNAPGIAKGEPTGQSKQAPKQTATPKPEPKRTQAERKETRQNENLPDRLARLKEKYKKNPTPELKQRIADLEARIKVGDTKGNTTDQPGTPTRPFRNRGVTNRPLSYGGKLRI